MERLAGAVERFVCGSGGRVEVSKCRAVLGTAFAGAQSELGGWGGRDEQGCLGWPARPAGCANGAERSAAPEWMEMFFMILFF